MATITTKYPFVGTIETRQGGRKENQDYAGFVDTPLGLLVVVCDGMGGGPGGRTASHMAINTILSVLSEVSEHTPREDGLEFAISKANDIIYSKAKETPELRGMGTTVAAILINEDSAVIAHAGDTRIYQLRKGAIVYRSTDHSFVGNLVRLKKITEEEARNHPQSNIVTRALGIRPTMEIEIEEVAFQRGDRFVICTDGVWGMMPQRDLVKSLSQVMGIVELAYKLAEEIDNIGKEAGGGHDNLTLAIVDTTFESLQRKIKNKQHAVGRTGVNDIESKKVLLSKKNIYIITTIFIIGCLILFILFQYWNSHSEQENEQSPIPIQQKGATVTTIDTTSLNVRIVKETEEENVDTDKTTNNFHIIENQNPQVQNPFQDSKLNEERRKNVTERIRKVTNNLDSLKKINGQSKSSAETKKKAFLQSQITPGVKSLGEVVLDEKKVIVDSVLSMLNNKMTVECDNKGRSTPNSKKHIEQIKTKVRKLGN